MDNRFNKLLLYLEKLKISPKNLVAIKSDASFRKYYRLENNILAMDAAPEKGESVSKFSEIAEILHSFNLSAPKIIDVNNKEGFIILEDFGDKVFSNYMNKENKKNLYKKAIDVLIDIKIKSHQNKSSLSKLTTYNFEELYRESILFIEWFIEQKLGMQIGNKKRDEFYQILQQAFLNIKSKNDTLVLRDYHVDNLILKDHKEPLKQVGLIDFQDAFQVGLGFMFITIGSRYIPPHRAALYILLEPILAPIWAWAGVGENPPMIELLGGLIVFAFVTWRLVDEFIEKEKNN